MARGRGGKERVGRGSGSSGRLVVITTAYIAAAAAKAEGSISIDMLADLLLVVKDLYYLLQIYIDL